MEEITLSVHGKSSGSYSCAKLFTFGAHISSWKTGETEHLWMSSLSNLDGVKPIRGGIPIAWPQFADNGHLQLHGFARERIWKVASRSTLESVDCVTLLLESDEETMKVYPFKFQLTLVVELKETSLEMSLGVLNLSSTRMPFSGCFHTYFRTPDVRACKLTGLINATYIDKVDEFKTKTQGSSSIEDDFDVSDEVALVCGTVPGYFIDRIYTENVPPAVVFTDNGTKKRIEIDKSDSWKHWVVFNPWEEGKKGAKGPDFDDDGYNYMLCVEPSVAIAEVVLDPNEHWVGSQILKLSLNLA
jgi:glucose-6-phosphate 1-epimerase